MSDEDPGGYRFATDVSPDAPKVGHHLATVSYQLGREQVILWVIEGPQNDSVGLLGMATDFERTRLLSFSLRGSLFERLNQIPPGPYDRGMRFRFSTDDPAHPTPVEEADVVFSGLRSDGRLDPDSAAVRFLLSEPLGGGRLLAAITGYQRGWLFQPVIVAAALSIWVLNLSGPAPEDTEVRLAVEQEHGGLGGTLQLQGSVAHRATIISS